MFQIALSHRMRWLIPLAAVLCALVASSDHSIIHVFLPSEAVYPEHVLLDVVEKIKERVEEEHTNVTLHVTEVQSTDENLVSDSLFSSKLFKTGEIRYCIGLVRSKVALEMATFLSIPTVTYANHIDLLGDLTSRIAINPPYWNGAKAILSLLKFYDWRRVNFIVSELPWYTSLWDTFDEYNSRYEKQIDNSFKLDSRSDQSKFTLRSYEAEPSYYEELAKKTQTANIFVFLGHECEMMQYLLTAYDLGFLRPGKILIHLDLYGQMLFLDEKFGSRLPNCTGILESPLNGARVKEAMQYLIVGVTHWMDKAKVKSDTFAEKYNISKQDESGFSVLLVDSLTLLIGYISANTTQDFYTYAQSPDRGAHLYSGALRFKDRWRDLEVGVNFYHQTTRFSVWTDCDQPTCVPFTIEIDWAGDVRPVSKFEDPNERRVELTLVLLSVAASLIFVSVSAGLITHIYKKHRCTTSQNLWRLDEKDFDFNGMVELNKLGSGSFPKSYRNVRCFTAKYKNCDVFVKEVCSFHTNIAESYELTVDLVRRISKKHDNVNPLIGVRVIADEVQIVQPLCAKGSLMDVLQRNPLKINNCLEYKLHILISIAQGLSHLHNTLKIPHGNLKTTNCVVDGTWVVKVSDYEPPGIRISYEENTENMENYYAQKLWTAPELLVSKKRLSKAEAKSCDVYSFAIICYEVLAATSPYHERDGGGCPHSYSEIVKRVKVSSEPPFRPDLRRMDCHGEEELYKLVRLCWSHLPTLRPTVSFITRRLEQWTAGADFEDFIATEMEKYSSGLGQKIEDMEERLTVERYKYEGLLQKLLPKQVASCIKAGRQPPFETAEVSLYFSDIYNFTKISNLRKFKDDPKLIVEFLNMLYELLDTIVGCFDENLYKVETINDSYLVMSGLPYRQDKNHLHACYIAHFALLVLSRVNEIVLDGYPDVRVQIRVGIHSGELAAGVVGQLNPRYCLFGDTVNFTSRLESTGRPFTIHTSEKTVGLLAERRLFKIVKRSAPVTLKNRGDHQTFFIVDMTGFDWELPKETLDLQLYGDRADHASDNVSIVSGRSGRTRQTSTCSTEYSFTDTGIGSAQAESFNRSKKLSSSPWQMRQSVSETMSLIDKMRNPEKLNVFQQERPARRAFSEPDGGNPLLRYSGEDKKQRMSTPFRKESEEQLQYSVTEDRYLQPIQEPDLKPNPESTEQGILRKGSSSRRSVNSIRSDHTSPESSDTASVHINSEVISLSEIGKLSLSKVYNHDPRISSPDQTCSGGSESEQDNLDETPTNLQKSPLRRTMERRDTTTTLVAPTAFAIPMGVKRYSSKQKLDKAEYTSSDTDQ